MERRWNRRRAGGVADSTEDVSVAQRNSEETAVAASSSDLRDMVERGWESVATDHGPAVAPKAGPPPKATAVHIQL